MHTTSGKEAVDCVDYKPDELVHFSVVPCLKQAALYVPE